MSFYAKMSESTEYILYEIHNLRLEIIKQIQKSNE
jgi:hypothetical protein